MLEKFWWLIDKVNREGNTPLDEAREDGAEWAFNLLSRVKSRPESIKGAPLIGLRHLREVMFRLSLPS